MANQSTIMTWNPADYFKPSDTNSASDSNSATATASAATANANEYSSHINGNAPFNGDSLSNGYVDDYYVNGLSTALPSSQPSPVPLSSSASSSPSFYPFNQSFQYQYDYINDTPINSSSNARIGYESGSNYMLLVEDFNTYFHNYNDSVGIGIGTTGPTNLNATAFDFQSNCSLANSTCEDILGKLEQLFSSTFYNTLEGCCNLSALETIVLGFMERFLYVKDFLTFRGYYFICGGILLYLEGFLLKQKDFRGFILTNSCFSRLFCSCSRVQLLGIDFVSFSNFNAIR